MVVFHRIAGFDHLYTGEARHRAQHCVLHIDRQRSADPVGINQMSAKPLRFQENLMPIAITKAMNLVLN